MDLQAKLRQLVLLLLFASRANQITFDPKREARKMVPHQVARERERPLKAITMLSDS